MGPKGTLRAIQAAERRRQRDAQKRFRELERQAKEQAKLSEIEQARLEVETYENRVEVLQSVYKDQGEPCDWPALATSLPPPCPQKTLYHEQRANQRFAVLAPEKKEAAQHSVFLLPCTFRYFRAIEKCRNLAFSYATQGYVAGITAKCIECGNAILVRRSKRLSSLHINIDGFE